MGGPFSRGHGGPFFSCHFHNYTEPSNSENDIPHKIDMIEHYIAETLTENADYDDDQVREAAANAHTLCVEVTEALRYRMDFGEALRRVQAEIKSRVAGRETTGND